MKRYLLPLLALALAVRVAQADDLASGAMPQLVQTTPPTAAFTADLDILAAEIVSLSANQPDQFSILSGNEIADQPQADVDLAALYKHAVKAERLAKLKQRLLAIKKMADARKMALLALEKSLVEREQARIEADTATPEDSPTPIPFSLDRPESFVSDDVSSDQSLDSLTGPVEADHLAATPEPPTWALVGVGLSFLLFRFGRRPAAKASSLPDQLYRNS
jgi:hypothetical protein